MSLIFLERATQTLNRRTAPPAETISPRLDGARTPLAGWFFAVKDLSGELRWQLGSASPGSTPASQLLVATQAAVLQPWGFSVSDSKVPLS